MYFSYIPYFILLSVDVTTFFYEFFLKRIFSKMEDDLKIEFSFEVIEVLFASFGFSTLIDDFLEDLLGPAPLLSSPP